jgi:3-phosphoshikimate 1-carboxyvinyltransferase
MRTFGAEVDDRDHRFFTVAATGYEATAIDLEPDASAASYFFAAAAITGGTVRVEGLGTASIQGDLAFVDVLEDMGAEVTRGPDFTEVTGTGVLRGITVDMSGFSDTAQTLAIVASFATSPTTITGIDFIRRKETDRIAAVVRELTALGIRASEDADGMTIEPGVPTPGVVQTYDDHRMAMSFALLGLVHPGIEIADPGCVAKTFPGFFDELERLRRDQGDG